MENIRRKGPVNNLEQLVTEKLATYGLPVGKMYDLSAIDEVQKKLHAEFQIVVLAASHCNFPVISRSPRTKTSDVQEIVVYHNTEHYDLITSIEGFLMSGNYSEHCEKSYSNKERHYCKGTCPYCFCK